MESNAPDCGRGMRGYELKPGESAMFSVVTGKEPNCVVVGFKFWVGKELRLQVAWSDQGISRLPIDQVSFRDREF